MCGITGVFGNGDTQNILQTVEAMAASLVHRGPDDHGVWLDQEAKIALGHRRLSVLDLSLEGRQPMLSGDGRFVMVFNGEVYNHQIIREELECKGKINWRGYSDTEVMLAAISDWGLESAISKFTGMFAIVLWDRIERKLHLIRDRMGEKPLYYGWCNGAFIFGSELKALRKYPGFDNSINRDALALYFRYMVIPSPFTIYNHIYKLQPGCILSLQLSDAIRHPDGIALRADLSNNSLHLRRWWSLHKKVESGQASLINDENYALKLLENKLRDSIRGQSVADVPLGAFLSGGVDSSLIASLMQSEASAPISTFTIGFREKKYNEANYAKAVAKHLGTEHVELYVTAKDALDVIQGLPSLYDEPFADSSQIPTFLLCTQAKKQMTVALSGDAGDELFCGYNRYFWAQKIWNKISWLPISTRRLISRTIFLISPQVLERIYTYMCYLITSSRDLSSVGQKLHNMAERLISVGSEDELLFNMVSNWALPEEVVMNSSEPTTLLTQSSQWPSLSDLEHRMMYLDSMTYLPDDILTKVDRAAMGISLETRMPFLDHRVVELAWQLPLRMKFRDNQGKWALRKILYKYVPSNLIERPKQGFSIPLGDWLRGPLREWAEELLKESRLKREAFFNHDPIRLKWQQHLAGQMDWSAPLWVVLMFQAWFESQKSG